MINDSDHFDCFECGCEIVYLPERDRACPKCGRKHKFVWDADYEAVLTDEDWDAIRAAKGTSPPGHILIAAAPDLLEACQMAYDEFQPLSLGEEDSAMSLLRAAIAKATNGGKPT